MRYFPFILPFAILLFAGCSRSGADVSAPPPGVYTEGATYQFTVTKEGEECAEQLVLTREETLLGRIPEEEKLNLSSREPDAIEAAWQLQECSADSLYLTEAKVSDNGMAYSLSYPQTQLLHFAPTLPEMVFSPNMPLNETKVSTRYQLGKSSNVSAEKAVSERTYRGRETLTLADTTYEVHKIEAISDSRLGKIRHTYYFHDSLGFVHSNLRLPDGSLYRITLSSATKKP